MKPPAGGIDQGRRRFLGTAAMTIAAVHLGMLGAVEGSGGEPRELAALGRAREWLNSPAADAVEPRRESRARRLLDVHLHQLAAHASIRARMGEEIPAGPRRDRRAHTRVRGSNRNSTTFAAHCGRCESSTRSRSTTTTQSGAPSTTNTGRPSTLSMRGARSASITSARASTNGRRPPFNACWRRTAPPLSAEGAVSVEGQRRGSGRRIGTTCDRRRTTSATTEPRTSRRPEARAGSAPRYAAPARLTLNQWALAGEWTMGSRQPSSAVPAAVSPAAFMRATCISSWDRHGREALYVSACRLTVSRRVLRTAWTWTTAATARWSSRVCIS